MGGACDLHLALAGTNRFDQHQVKAGSIDERGRISRGP
jgi:hypothetical protein